MYLPFKKTYSVYWELDTPDAKDYVAYLKTLDWGEYPIREDGEICYLSFEPFFFGYVSPNNPMVSRLKQEAMSDIADIKDGFLVISGEMIMSRSN